MSPMIARVWIGALLVGLAFVAIRTIIPALVNSHNDGALIAAPVFALAVGTTAYVTFIKVFKEDDE